MTRLPLLALLALSACAAPVARPSAGTVAAPYPRVGLERVLGQDATGLAQLFGTPDADVREGTARKLQFAGPICILDAYLYSKGGETARVTYLDARQPDGSTIDRASCVAALTRREGGR